MRRHIQPQWGYLDPDSLEETIEPNGEVIVTAWYVDQDGGEIDFIEFYKSELMEKYGKYKLPEMWEF